MSLKCVELKRKIQQINWFCISLPCLPHLPSPQTAQVISFLWGFLLPSVGVSLYFYSSPEPLTEKLSPPTTNGALKGHINHAAQFDGDTQVAVAVSEKGDHIQLSSITKDHKTIENGIATAEPVRTFSWARASNLLWAHFKTSYSNAEVVQWSLWWALALCGSLQVKWKLLIVQNFITCHKHVILSFFFSSSFYFYSFSKQK